MIELLYELHDLKLVTCDLKLGNLKKIAEMLGIDSKYAVGQPKKQILTVALENFDKSDIKNSEKTYII